MKWQGQIENRETVRKCYRLWGEAIRPWTEVTVTKGVSGAVKDKL